jgi:AraC-like DNA-binding protein
MVASLPRTGAHNETNAAIFLPKRTMSHDISSLIARHCRDPLTPSAVPRLMLSRSDAPTVLSPAIFTPLLCVLARGRKRVFLGRDEYRYDPDNYLIASADLPVRGQVLVAPCLALTLTIDPALVAELLLDAPPYRTHVPSPALAVSPLDDDLANALERLLRLLDHPADIPVLAGLIEREIVYRLLCGPQGEMLRQLARPSSQLSQISRAIGIIRSRYDEKIRIDELARAAGMSPTSFHRHFRRVTAMSPLQFQKRIRLHEARRMLLLQSADATHVSLDVGYESTSQFNREYRRLFGRPPARDAAEVRRAIEDDRPSVLA